MTRLLTYDSSISSVGNSQDSFVHPEVAGNVLPSSYPIQLTPDFLKRFSQDAIAVPPQPIRIEIFNANQGRQLLEERRREVEALNVKALEAFRLEVATAESVNRLIDESNEKSEAEYREKHRKYESDLAVYEANWSCEAVRQEVEEELIRELGEQDEPIKALVSHVGWISRWEMLHGRTYLIWLAALVMYAFLSINFRQYLFLAALPAFIAADYLIYANRKSKRDQANNWPNKRPWAIGSMADVPGWRADEYHWTRYAAAEFASKNPKLLMTLLGVISSCTPVLSPFVVCFGVWRVTSHVLCTSSGLEQVLAKRKGDVLCEATRLLSTKKGIAFLTGRHPAPTPPAKPLLASRREMPSPPPTLSAEPPEPPQDCYDNLAQREYGHTLRGSVVYSAEENQQFARSLIYSGGQVRAYFPFGPYPIEHAVGSSSNTLVAGTSGSGKTTILKHSLSALLPLTRSQAQRIVEQSPDFRKRVPSSSHEWSRSFTHQAVVYNAKDEFIPFLVALGFNVERDLLILDPADARCWSWDVASDITDRRSISQFVNFLMPAPKGNDDKGDVMVWIKQARRLAKGVLVSFVNAARKAGKRPQWNLRDLVNAFSTRESLRHVLQHHDVPEKIIGQLMDLYEGTASSVFFTATGFMANFEETGERWAEAERQGRKLSLKAWALEGSHSVIVLPNTLADVGVNEPLNAALFKALVNICLTDKYSRVRGLDGRERNLKRYFIFDELGQAGRLADLERGMAEGRSSSLHFIVGVHQRSQLLETYGKNVADTILGLCPNAVLLRTGDPEMADWCSKRGGECLREYEKRTFSYGTSKGEVFSQMNSTSTGETHGKNLSQGSSVTNGTQFSQSESSGGSNSPRTGNTSTRQSTTTRAASYQNSEQTTEGSSHQTSESVTVGSGHNSSTGSSEHRSESDELRKEAAVYPSEFLNLPDPKCSGTISGYVIVPHMPLSRIDVQFALLQPLFERPEALTETARIMEWPNEEEVSRTKPWDAADYSRLCIAPPKSALSADIAQCQEIRRVDPAQSEASLSAKFDWAN